MTIDQMIARKREEIRKNLEARSANVTELAAIRDKTEVTEADEALPADIADALKTPKDITDARGKVIYETPPATVVTWAPCGMVVSSA